MQTVVTLRKAVRSGRSAFLAGLIIVASLALSSCSSPREQAPATDFVLLSGAKYSAAQLKGRVTLVNFWATSCASCVKEMPQMVQTYQQFAPKGFDLIAVAMSYDPPNYVVNYAETRKLPFKVALDSDGAAARAYPGVKVTPTSFLVDKQGRIAKRWVGEPDFAQLHKEITGLLAES